ncbi:MAG: transcription antitermination factor NusB [Flavobacterium sp.]|nr:transcription antitermination factor NusB [Flavobacterium sp.]
MQSIYAMHQNESDNLEKQEKFLLASIENILDLYLVIISALIELRKKEQIFIEKSKLKHLATPEELNPNLKFINNSILLALEESSTVSIALEKRKINNFQNNDDTVLLLLEDIKQSKFYEDYMTIKSTSFTDERNFIADLFEQIIAPNEKLYNYLEDYKLTWVDDIPLVNTEILKQLKQFPSNDERFKIPKVYKDEEDKEYAINLFRKTVLNETDLEKEYENKTPNWDITRIAKLDTTILKMAICEFLKFPSIPLKVTINEYLEIAKEYSTPNSSVFINGILDNLSKELLTTEKIKKTGRGLM